MKRVLHKGDYYIERRLDSYNIYRILEDTDDLSGVKCERIWIRPESIYNFGETQVYMMDIDYRDYYRQISPGLATLIKDECEAFERTIKLMLENVTPDPDDELAPGKCFTLQYSDTRFEFARIDYFEEIIEGEGVTPVYELEEPGGEVHGEYLIMGENWLGNFRTWLIYDKFMVNNDKCVHTYPPYLFDIINDLMLQRTKYIWDIIEKYLEVLKRNA